jgi:hypothetical protein
MCTLNDVPAKVSVAIHKDTHAKFAKACKQRSVGRSMNDAATRLVEWFVRQSQPVQTAVLSDVDSGMEHYYAAALEQLAEDERRKGTGQNHTHGPGSSPLPPAPAAPGATKREPDPQQGRLHNTPPKVARTRGEGHSRG